MRQATVDKINRVKKMIHDGLKEEEIVKAAFGRNWKKYNAFMLQHNLKEVSNQFKKPDYSDNISILEDIPTVSWDKEDKRKGALLENGTLMEFHSNDLERLKKLIDRSDDLLLLLDGTKEQAEEIQILTVPEDLVRIKDIRVRSVRLSESLENEFDALVEENKLYSKTSLINHALREYLQKYK